MAKQLEQRLERLEEAVAEKPSAVVCVVVPGGFTLARVLELSEIPLDPRSVPVAITPTELLGAVSDDSRAAVEAELKASEARLRRLDKLSR